MGRCGVPIFPKIWWTPSPPGSLTTWVPVGVGAFYAPSQGAAGTLHLHILLPVDGGPLPLPCEPFGFFGVSSGYL